MTPISALLPTYNSARTVRKTLESIKWVDEILVVDSYSSDETLDICREYGARLIQHEYVNSATQKNWALPQCRNEWVLQIDSDEILSEGLMEDVKQAVAAAPEDIHAFRMPRENYMLGRCLRHGGSYPDYQVRLVRRDRGRWQDREVHAHFIVSGTIGTLTNPIIHYDVPSIAKPLRNLDRYTRYESDELRKRGACFHWYDLVIRPLGVFASRYVWQQGYRDGWRGFIMAAYWSSYVFFTRAKLWESETVRIETEQQSSQQVPKSIAASDLVPVIGRQ